MRSTENAGVFSLGRTDKDSQMLSLNLPARSTHTEQSTKQMRGHVVISNREVSGQLHLAARPDLARNEGDSCSRDPQTPDGVTYRRHQGCRIKDGIIFVREPVSN